MQKDQQTDIDSDIDEQRKTKKKKKETKWDWYWDCCELWLPLPTATLQQQQQISRHQPAACIQRLFVGYLPIFFFYSLSCWLFFWLGYNHLFFPVPYPFLFSESRIGFEIYIKRKTSVALPLFLNITVNIFFFLLIKINNKRMK